MSTYLACSVAEKPSPWFPFGAQYCFQIDARAYQGLDYVYSRTSRTAAVYEHVHKQLTCMTVAPSGVIFALDAMMPKVLPTPKLSNDSAWSSPPAKRRWGSAITERFGNHATNAPMRIAETVEFSTGTDCAALKKKCAALPAAFPPTFSPFFPPKCPSPSFHIFKERASWGFVGQYGRRSSRCNPGGEGINYIHLSTRTLLVARRTPRKIACVAHER